MEESSLKLIEDCTTNTGMGVRRENQGKSRTSGIIAGRGKRTENRGRRN
jgi:hypothetical protein